MIHIYHLQQQYFHLPGRKHTQLSYGAEEKGDELLCTPVEQTCKLLHMLSAVLQDIKDAWNLSYTLRIQLMPENAASRLHQVYASE